MHHHSCRHPIGIGFFAPNVRYGCPLGFGANDVAVNLARLTEPPEPADCLIELLKAICQADESGISAMLPVHAKSAYRRLTYQNTDAAFAKVYQLSLFRFLAIGTANLNSAGDRFSQPLALAVEATPPDKWAIGRGDRRGSCHTIGSRTSPCPYALLQRRSLHRKQ